jgi:beta-lactamase regulating signal transducer with metallopeptidase domain
MKTSILVLVALCATRLLPNRSAALRHWILTLAIAGAAVLPLCESMVPSWGLSLRPASFSEIGLESRVGLGSPRSLRSAGGTIALPRTGGLVERLAPNELNAWQMASLLGVTWIAGTTISLAILGVGLARLTSLRSRAQQLTDGNWPILASEIARELGLERSARLLLSDHPSLLATWGVRSPSIIIPAAARRWPDELVRIVLRHELAHIKRRDWFIQLAAEIVRSVYWFNPLFWLACRRLRLESERACDDVVLRSGIEGAVYARHLIDLARELKHPQTLFPAPAMARSSSLHKRVTAMLNICQNRNPMSLSARIITLVLLVGVAGAIAAAQVFATFSGSLFDAQGAVLPGVAVTLTNADRQMKYNAQSSRTGEFQFVGLPPGDYVLEALVPGFKPYRAALTMTGANARRAITMQIGSLQETVTIVEGEEVANVPVSAASARPNPPCSPAAAAGDVAIGGNVRPPRRFRNVKPVYPATLRGTGTEGSVVLDAVIGLDGFLKDVRVHEPANRELGDALVTAVNQWQWDSTLLNCVPIEVPITVTGRFERRR